MSNIKRSFDPIAAFASFGVKLRCGVSSSSPFGMAKSKITQQPSNEDQVDDNDFEYHAEPGHLVRRLHQIAVSIFFDLMSEFDLTPIQYAILNAVDAHPGYEQRQIATLIAVDRTTINAVTTKLAQRGLIVREPIGRRIDLWVTKEGQALLRDASPRTALHADRVLEPLTPSQRQDFQHLLQQVVDGNNSISRVPQKKPVLKNRK